MFQEAKCSVAFLSSNLLYIFGIIIALVVLAFIIRLVIRKELYRSIFNWFNELNKIINSLLFLIGIGKKDANKEELNESFAIAGYAYDEKQDIFYSIKDAWQRNFGYCRLYDEAAAPLGMIVDCDPIYFEYNGKKWLIEFWKGQYDLPTGAEVGIYATDGPDLNIPGFFNGTFYHCVSDDELLWMSFTLKKKGKVLFERGDRHWWLTGFRLGEFSQPSELTMEITMTLKDQLMCTAFIEGLKRAGYSDKEVKRYGNSVRIIFDKPHTPQPLTRTEITDGIIQAKNKLLCDLYNEVTQECITLEEKMNAVREKEPELYKHILALGRPAELYSSYEKIQRHL
ncbi:DUF4474 domain-containing protein [Acetivibrio mesophilus]|uniref:DUF4474 domain-containing protein n=1 Tax=Acetivibrio mesophilus TaxID=2487273 RepID=A0A4Q0I8F6_9FIRM|nr:DUF4474 domain-containing protein [Acetivibrio mesophilus]ODM26207.1 hypothetical protein A7W90_08200 [Clostridium sp. Bc-iso-3]RXE60741.1 DUF4474 domain-containing protein [Acetivibrio mesophilus]HHV28156.1 DUF4474 domain-containing protein [Clostridium sp.]